MKHLLIYFELDSFRNWALFFVKDLLFSAIVAAIAIWIKDLIVVRTKASKIVIFLLDKNHATREALKGRHLADRLLDIYNNGEPTPLLSGNQVYERPFWSSVWNESTIDKMLEMRGLVEVYEERGQQYVRLIDDRTTKNVIRRLVKLVKQEKL